MSTIKNENDVPNHPPLLQYSNTAPIENVILQQKVKRLSLLCENHKSKYEQITAKLQMDLNKKEDEYNTKSNILYQLIKNQSLKLQFLENELQKTKQQSDDKDIKHNDSITSLKRQLNRQNTDITQLQQDNRNKQDQIKSLISKLSVKDESITMLKQKLSAAMQQFKPTDHPSPSTTKKIMKSRTISYSHSDQLHPDTLDEKESPSVTFTAVRYHNRNLDTIELSLTASILNKKNIDNGHTVKWADQKKMSKPKINIHIPSQHYLASDHDYDPSDTEDYLSRSVNNTPLITPFPQLKHIKEVSFPDIDEVINAFHLSRSGSTSHGLLSRQFSRQSSNGNHGLKNSETHILEDVAANGTD